MTWYFIVLFICITITCIWYWLQKEVARRLRHLYFRDRVSCRDRWSQYGHFPFWNYIEYISIKNIYELWLEGETEFILHYNSGGFKYVQVSRIYRSYLVRVDPNHSLF